jgi:tRNA pseudouridine38-40 synthase
MKIALLIAYDGTDFHGFARQRTSRTVQGLIEDRLTTLLRAPTSVVGAGRTDTGVHASGQVVDLPAADSTDPTWLKDRLNRWLAPEIAVKAAAEVPDDFSARFSAVRREYEYRIYRSPIPDPFRDRFMLWMPDALHVASMRAAARDLIGEHDFSSFCRKGEGSMVRNLRAIKIVTREDELTFKVSADSFCHQMVRSIVGFLLDVGKGAPKHVLDVLAARDRNAAGTVAAARGLHLTRVVYRPDPFLGPVTRTRRRP